MHSNTGRKRLLGVIAVSLFITGLTLPAFAEDSRAWRLYVRRDGELYRGVRPFTLHSVERTAFYQPGPSDTDIIKTFIEISNAGATSITFNLTGFNEDGTGIDDEAWKAVERIKAESDYRWIPSICRVLGAYEDASDEFRMNAVKTAAEKFRGEFAALYWIDGPNHEALAKAFKAIAPELLVAAPSGGDVAVIDSPADAQDGIPNLLVGQIPEDPNTNAMHSVLFGEDALERYEAAIRDPRELAEWNPTTYGLSEEEIAEGFVALFDGETLDGWSFTGLDKGAWAAEDNMIVWQRTGGGHLRTLRQFDDYILRLEWKLSRENANSGLLLRTPRANRESKMGFEFQMMGDHGIEPHKNSTGAIYDVLPAKVNAGKPVGEWNELEIRLDGPHFKATLNGAVVQEVNFDENPELRYRKRKGFIILQDHQHPVWFKNIRIKEL